MDEKHQSTAKSAWEQAAAEGIDMSLIEASLRRSPIERIRVHARALAAATQLMEAVSVDTIPEAAVTDHLKADTQR